MDDQRVRGVIGCVVLLCIALVSVPIFMSLLFPWEPPRAEGAPREAVVRVVAPEGAPYSIDWGSGEPTSSSVEEGRYRDHAVPGYADTTGLLDVHKADSEGNSLDSAAGINSEAWEGEIYAILYADGEAVSCDSGGSRDTSIQGASVSFTDYGSRSITRPICNGYRYWSYLF